MWQHGQVIDTLYRDIRRVLDCNVSPGICANQAQICDSSNTRSEKILVTFRFISHRGNWGMNVPQSPPLDLTIGAVYHCPGLPGQIREPRNHRRWRQRDLCPFSLLQKWSVTVALPGLILLNSWSLDGKNSTKLVATVASKGHLLVKDQWMQILLQSDFCDLVFYHW